MQLNRNDSAVSRIGNDGASAAEYAENNGCPDLLERAFQLAYFIVQDRSVAIDIVARAKKKLAVEQSREKKRAYWRNKSLKQKIRRMTRDEQDALQWLIYCESDKYESQQEREGSPDQRSLGMRYIKFVVQMTVNMSCFYVAVGLHRILHNYSTPEVQLAYDLLTEEYAGAEKYRRVKRKLMQKVARRFCEFITIGKSDNQELRFEVHEDQKEWVDLATRCLEMFTPWSTTGACLPQADLRPEPRMVTSGHSRQEGSDTREMRRCHIFIHPFCFDQLTKRLGLDPRRERLAMPRFRIKGGPDSQDDSHWAMRPAAQLTSDERRLLNTMSASEQRPKIQRLPASLTILADGALCARVNLSQETPTQWRIEEGVKLIEFCAETEAGETEVFAMHWVDYTEVDGIAAGEYTIAMGSGEELIIKTIPAGCGSNEAGDAMMFLAIRPRSRLARWSEQCKSLIRFPHLPRYALAAIVILSGWLWSAHQCQGEITRRHSIIDTIEKHRVSAAPPWFSQDNDLTPMQGVPSRLTREVWGQ